MRVSLKYRCLTLSAIVALFIVALAGCRDDDKVAVPLSDADIVADTLGGSWEEGIPLGNATIGAMVWQRDSMLRLTLDRSDLWDLRANDSLSGPDYNFDWLTERLNSNHYSDVQRKFDASYDNLPYPTKFPAGAMEFAVGRLGRPNSVRLYLRGAVCEVTWPCGARFITFVSSVVPDVGFFRFYNLPSDVDPEPVIVPPSFQGKPAADSVRIHLGHTVSSLGYGKGTVSREPGKLVYHQKCFGTFAYDIAVNWERSGSTLTGAWSITSTHGALGTYAPFESLGALNRGFDVGLRNHLITWNKFWSRSSISVPDSMIQRQYERDIYKLGCAAATGAHPISLQSVWTYDTLRLPSWKGDYHYSLRVPLCYLPVWGSNHPELARGLLNTLWDQRDKYREYTRTFFGKPGINVPGSAALDGQQMGGWAQYAMSQTVGAQMARFFWLHWKYTGDSAFLAQRAYPFTLEVARFLEAQTVVGRDCKRRLEYSSSPELFDNRPAAWFRQQSNFDLALMKTAFANAAEMADSLERPIESDHWRSLLEQLPDFSTRHQFGDLTYADGIPYDTSHRTLSHAWAIYPLGLIDPSQGPEASDLIDKTIWSIDSYGSKWWTGYSFGLYGGLLARAGRGDRAAGALHLFIERFTFPNTLHVNGDHLRTGTSRMIYIPYSIDGNFVSAAATQELLLQSVGNTIRVFPAIPLDWRNVSFTNLRAMGGVLVSARLEKGSLVRLELQMDPGARASTFNVEYPGGRQRLSLSPGQSVVVKTGDK